MAGRLRMAAVAGGLAVVLLCGCGFPDAVRPPGSMAESEVWVAPREFAERPVRPQEAGRGVAFVPGQLVVQLREGKFTDSVISSLCARHGGEVRGKIARLRLVLLNFGSGADLAQAKARLEVDPEVAAVGLNHLYDLCGTAAQDVAPTHITNDPWFPIGQWGLIQIGFHRVAAEVLPATAPVVAVVDTGVDYTHPDLKGQILLGPDFYDGDMDPMDTHGHGTLVAGTIAAATDNNRGIAGVSGKSQVLAVRVGAAGVPGFAAAAGIVYAADCAGVRVINLGWGGRTISWYIRDAVAYAVGKGILVVAAAGNEDDLIETYPAAYPGVLAVGATGYGDEKACFSNYGSYVRIAAPGVDIYSTTLNGGYGPGSGTSLAAAFVSGAAALVWGKWPDLSASEVTSTLTRTGDAIQADPCSGRRFPTGVGRLNLYAAFAARIAMPPAGGALLGLVVDAHSGLPLGGATVTAASGTITRTATTRSDGTFTLTNLPADVDFTVTASRTTYVTTVEERTWRVREGNIEWLVFFALPKVQGSDVFTAVVEWRGWCGCGDLDAYLWLPSSLPDRNKYMVSWRDRGNLNAHPFARFLRDEPWESPWRSWDPVHAEALTFRTRYAGTFTFAVGSRGSCNWSCADAVVRLYRGDSLVGTWRAAEAAGFRGGWWTVFRASGTTATAVQRLGDVFPGPYGQEVHSSYPVKRPGAGVAVSDGEFRWRAR